MSDLFTDPDERRLIVADVAARRGVAPWVIEKDLWVCWTLARLHEIPDLPELTFKGGTSLSKVHRLIDRFSEDIDLTFSRAGWGYVEDRDPLASGLSGKRRQQLVDEIVARSTAIVRDVVLPALQAHIAHLGAPASSVSLADDDDQAILLAYPEPTTGYGYGVPVVKIEFGARGDPWPTARHVVRPYIDDEHPGSTRSAIAEVVALQPERTFWEKATLLHALHHGTLAKPDKRTESLSRHLYDLHRMWTTPDVRERLADPMLLDAVVANKEVFFTEGKARYDLVRERRLDSTPHEALARTLRADHAAMASMFFPGQPVPTFEELLATTREVDALVASWVGR